jgi:predicted NAD/FAD-binding protein
MKIAIIGTGIAGNVAAYQLAREHDITVYEADDRIGGHTHTVDVEQAGERWAVDTGFIVYNERTYPKFVALLNELGVASQTSDMSFSVSTPDGALEYNGASLNTLFAQRRNLLRPSFYRMLLDILRFNREAAALLGDSPADLTLGDYLSEKRYSREFIDHYIVPMGAAIWSASPGGMLATPAMFFIRFFQNHGLLSVTDRPTWRVIRGGSRNYVERLVAGHRDRIRLNAPVRRIRRDGDHVEVSTQEAGTERFDRVFLACHSDQALQLLADPTPREQEVLGAIAYRRNEAVLHTDASMMPRRRRAWAAWNYQLPGGPLEAEEQVTLTYNMNILQSLEAPVEFCVTLNNTAAIDPDKIIRTVEYAHPVFTAEAVAAQQQHRALNGERNCYFCGAYWRHGFHEDGVVSALNAVEHFRQDLAPMAEHDEQRSLRRAS